MAGEKITSPKVASVDADAQARQRSSISFPYVDLGAVFNLAQAIHSHVGHGSCTEDQLAAWTNQSARSSGFREQIRAAKMASLVRGQEPRSARIAGGHAARGGIGAPDRVANRHGHRGGAGRQARADHGG